VALAPFVGGTLPDFCRRSILPPTGLNKAARNAAGMRLTREHNGTISHSPEAGTVRGLNVHYTDYDDLLAPPICFCSLPSFMLMRSTFIGFKSPRSLAPRRLCGTNPPLAVHCFTKQPVTHGFSVCDRGYGISYTKPILRPSSLSRRGGQGAGTTAFLVESRSGDSARTKGYRPIEETKLGNRTAFNPARIRNPMQT
jgi:hypothetical protein